MTADPQSQLDADANEQTVVKFLAGRLPTAETGGTVEIVETHAARVFLAGNTAFKTKKWVTLPFLDFSTEQRRHKALARELELNAPHAPEIYQRLIAITLEADGSLALEGKGCPIDWGLQMHRFPQDDVLLEVARRGPLDQSISQRLAAMAANYHLAAPPAYRSDENTRVAATLRPLLSALEKAGDRLDQSAVSSLAEKALAAHTALTPLLDARAMQGAVRRCHGDLHLGNIVMLGDRPVPFDALEFDEALATIDVLYDLAFLLMDLIKRGQRPAASHVFNAYVTRAPLGNELEGLRALPLFLAMRAAVRAVVALARAEQDGADRSAEEAHARGLVALANGFITPMRPALIAIGGFSGTGKSTLARGLAPSIGPAIGALVLRSDVERKQLFGVPETEHLSPDHYTEAVAEEIYHIVLTKVRRALLAGNSVIADAVFAKPHERDAFATLARETNASFAGLWLEAPADVLIERVEARRGDASDAGPAVVNAQLAYNTGKISWSRVSARGSSTETLGHAIEQLSKGGITLLRDGQP